MYYLSIKSIMPRYNLTKQQFKNNCLLEKNLVINIKFILYSCMQTKTW